MAKPGPKPLPTNLRVFEGGKPKPKSKDEPDPGEAAPELSPEDLPDPPKYLGREARRIFTETAQRLAKLRLLTDADVDALAMYAATQERYRKAVRKINREGMIIKAPSGYPQQSPYVAIATKALDQARKLLAEFGLTPSSRARIRG